MWQGELAVIAPYSVYNVENTVQYVAKGNSREYGRGPMCRSSPQYIHTMRLIVYALHMSKGNECCKLRRLFTLVVPVEVGSYTSPVSGLAFSNSLANCLPASLLLFLLPSCPVVCVCLTPSSLLAALVHILHLTCAAEVCSVCWVCRSPG